MDRHKRFLEIQAAYHAFYDSLRTEGKSAVRDTAVGIWGISGTAAVFEFFSEIHLENYKHIIDIGRGDASVVLTASLFTKATGIEFDDELYEKSIEVQKRLGIKDAAFIKGDFLQHNLASYDFVFINPDKGFHKGTEDKLLKELHGDLFVFNFVFAPRFLQKGKTYWHDQVPVTKYTRKD